MHDYGMLVLAVGVVIFGLIYLNNVDDECEKNGGVLIQGLIAPKCVKAEVIK